MHAAITADLLESSLQGPCNIWDTKVPGLVLRIRETGTRRTS